MHSAVFLHCAQAHKLTHLFSVLFLRNYKNTSGRAGPERLEMAWIYALHTVAPGASVTGHTLAIHLHLRP